MGIKCVNEHQKKIIITYDCVGKGRINYVVNEEEKLRKSLEKYIEGNGITINEINEVSYNYSPLDINKTIEELEIPNGAVIAIKLKSKFNK